MKGFTLLETLLYISLFSILMSGLFVSMIAINDSALHSEARAMKLLNDLQTSDSFDAGVHTIL